MKRMLVSLAVGLALSFAACRSAPTTAATPTTPPPSGAPQADHHAHLLSPVSAGLANEPPLPAIELPEALRPLARQMAAGWNDKAALAPLFTEDCVVVESRQPHWIRGRDEVAESLAGVFARPYELTPIACVLEGSSGHLAGYFTRALENGLTRYIGHALLALRKDADGTWRIAAETLTFPGPEFREPILAEELVAGLDAAGIQRAAVLSVAYWFGSAERPPGDDEHALVRAENDWTAAQVARYPERLVAFCSVNPLKDYAVAELDRCAKLAPVRGLKLHLGNSDVDLRQPEHVERVRRVFAAANERGLAVIVHLWTGPEYGREEAEIFLERILPAAPDIPVQIAHVAGGGPGYTDAALQVYADAIAAGDPRTRNLSFDVATVADGQPEDVLQKLAERIRQVGPHRVLYGTDMGPPAARESWQTFRTTVPLTDEEFATIAGNVAPYFR